MEYYYVILLSCHIELQMSKCIINKRASTRVAYNTYYRYLWLNWLRHAIVLKLVIFVNFECMEWLVILC